MRKFSKFSFSLVMSVCNTEEHISTAIEGILKQTIAFQRVQLVFVDNGSTDGSEQLYDCYASQYPQSITVIHQANQGISVTRNCGILVTIRIYIGFPD